MTDQNFSIAEVFRNAEMHRKVSRIVASHLVNRQDIRSLALNGQNISDSKQILDLGCGFGFFTEGLKDKVHPDAVVTGVDRFPEYEWFFLQSAEKAKLKARFLSNGSSIIRKMPSSSFDLVLCSYAMYFFTDIINEIPRVLKENGIFVTITHSIPHMQEFTSYVRNIVLNNGISLKKALPYEALISRFSNINGLNLLKDSFKDIKTEDFKTMLVFHEDQFDDFCQYFNFKHNFFIPESIDSNDKLHKLVAYSIKRDLESHRTLEITKDDIIFICSGPIKKDE